MTVLSKALLGVCGLLLVAVVALWARKDQAQRELYQQALVTDSIAAANDTLRRVTLSAQETKRLLGDSLAIYRKRATQVGVTPSPANKTLGQKPKASTTITSGSVTDTVYLDSVVVVGDTGVRTFKAIERSGPFKVGLDVAVPAAPAHGRAVVNVTVDPATFRVDLICGKKATNGVRPAEVQLVGPTWLPIQNVQAQQDASVCSEYKKNTQPWYKPKLVVSVGYGWTAVSEGSGGHEVVRRGPQAHVGLGIALPLF